VALEPDDGDNGIPLGDSCIAPNAGRWKNTSTGLAACPCEPIDHRAGATKKKTRDMHWRLNGRRSNSAISGRQGASTSLLIPPSEFP
jgi:hypothetical protein